MPLYVPTQQPAEYTAADHGFKTWAYDIHQSNNTQIVTGGVLTMVRMVNHTSAPMSVSTGYVYVGVAGATLTNVGFGLYNPTNQALLGTPSINASGATATAFQSVGLKPVTFTTPQVFAPGAAFYLAFWFTGTTIPTLTRLSTATGTLAANLATPNLRFATANTALTTTAPATYTAQSAAPADFWAAVS